MLEARTIDIGTGQRVSAVLACPPRASTTPPTAVVLAHGAGNDMRNPLLSAVHAGLAERGCFCLKFNFPYTERGRRAPDPAPILEACYRAVLDDLRGDCRLERARLIIGGKSLGGRMASHLAAAGVPVDGLVFLGYPLHPAGRPDKLRTAHLRSIHAPMLFVAGTRDALCTLPLLRAALRAQTAPVTLHIIEGGDHSFNVPKATGRAPQAVWTEIIDACAQWLATLPRTS